MDLKSIVLKKRMKFFVIRYQVLPLSLQRRELLPLGRPERGLFIKFIATKVTAIKLQGFNL